MEMLDVVDADDNVVRTLSRDEIHRQNLVHRACHMLLFNSAGELFLQKRSWRKDNDPGLWDSSAAGHVDAGETYLACAVRELEEELGLTITADDLTKQFKLSPIPETGMEFAVVYTLHGDQPLTLDPEEIETGQWFTPDEIDSWIERTPAELSNAFRLIWGRVRSVINS